MFDTKWATRMASLRHAAIVLMPVLAVWVAAVAIWPMETGSALIALAIVTIPTAWACAMTSQESARTWAAARGAQLHGVALVSLQRHLLNTRVARTLGVTAGIAVPLMLMANYNADPSGSQWFIDNNDWLNGWWTAGLGYLVGSVVAEMTKPRVPGSGDARGARAATTAVLVPRNLSTFVDPVVAWVAASAVALIGVAGLAWALAPRAGIHASGTHPIRAIAAPTITAVLALVAAAAISRRREHVDGEQALAYEELTRSASINALIGLCAAMAGATAASVATAPRADLAANWLVALVFALLSLVYVGFWVSSGLKLVFRSRRIDALRAAA